MSTEISEPVADADVQSAIERFQSVLSDNYLLLKGLCHCATPVKLTSMLFWVRSTPLIRN